MVLSETSLFAYKVDNWYAPTHDVSITWDDAALGIDWVLIRQRSCFQRRMGSCLVWERWRRLLGLGEVVFVHELCE